MIERDAQGRSLISRITYEICALQALREQLRCMESGSKGQATGGATECRSTLQELARPGARDYYISGITPVRSIAEQIQLVSVHHKFGTVGRL